jgi:hypothetical protein
VSELAAELGIEHTPHPGSRIDAAARGQAQQVPAADPPAIPEAPSVEAVPVRPVAAEEAVYRTMSLAAAAARQLLPQDPGRVRAVIVAIDNPVVLCATKELAQDAANQVTSTPYPTGFYLPVGVPLVVMNKSLVWVASTSASLASRISVVVEHADPGA